MESQYAERYAMQFIAIGLACLFCSCAKHGEPVSYPPHWPIPQLTVPPGSVRGRMASFDGAMFGDGYTCEVPGDAETEDYYALGFKPPGTWDQTVEHIENCLTPLGFVEIKKKMAENSLKTGNMRIRTYETPDEEFMVRVVQFYGNGQMRLNTDVYELRVYQRP